jgi:transketolase
VDGHNVKELVAALQELHPQKPLAIIAHTWKGHESLIEDLLGYHGKSMSLDEAEKSIQRIKALHPELAEFRPLFDMKENPYRPPAPNQLPLEFSSSQKVKVWLDLKTDPKKDDFVVGKKMATRTAYGAGLLALMKQDSNVFCLDGDVCNSTGTEPIFKALPAQSLQCFIAEQTMMSAAAGIARRGAVPFASTFAAFFSR